MKFYWFNKICCVPECFNSSTEGEGVFKEYFDLPAEAVARSKWLNAILSEDGEDLKICEDHFKDDDVFRDKNHRKKLRLNSIPARKLPKYVCTNCLGSKKPSVQKGDLEHRTCQCDPTPTPLQPIQQISSGGKRTRITWTSVEKKIIYKAIKSHGDVRVGNNNIRINWTNVINHCRANGCFGNEKEMRNVWQNMRINATKVFRNELFGSKLERKVSRFLYGKPPKKSRGNRTTPGDSGGNDTSNPNMVVGSTDDEDDFPEQSRPMIQDLPEADGEEEEEMFEDVVEENEENGAPVCLGEAPMGNTEENDENVAKEVQEEEESDEYYSISDVEQKFHINIRPRPPEEVISLLSSDEDN